MKITCIQENLNKALTHSSRIISVRSSLPILDNILFSTDHGRLKISATDLELGINYWIGAKIESDGAIAIPSRLITEFISNIKRMKSLKYVALHSSSHCENCINQWFRKFDGYNITSFE